MDKMDREGRNEGAIIDRRTHDRDVSFDGDEINILIVDDEPKNLTVLESILDESDYRLLRATSADEALLMLVSEEFALLILDVRMPGMTGFELAQMIKQRKKTSRIPIIFLTAYYHEDQHILTGYESGAVDYLHKPVNPTVLRSKVATFAELHRKSRELERVNQALLLEIAQRSKIEERLRDLNEKLETHVAERTQALVNAEAVLRDADRRKDEFLATLAHELRNPLAPLTTGLEIIKHNVDEPSKQAAQIMMERQLQHLVRLVDDLLDVARINHGKIDLKKNHITLQSVLDHAVEMTRPLIESTSQQLKISKPETPIWIYGDLTRLSQVVGNLLNNAAKYTPSEKSIELSASSNDGYAVIRVQDEGVGIPKEMLPKVFEMFGQVNRTIDLARGGLGIGLSLALKLIEMHDGDIVVESKGVNQGSMFTVRLPLAQPIPQAIHSSSHNNRSPSVHYNRILVVDDNIDAAESLAMLLRIQGHEVFQAHNGMDAIAIATETHPQITFLDIGLPDIDGYEVCQSLRRNEDFSDMMIVALTGWGAEKDKENALAAGFTRHIVKPVSIELLTSILDSYSRQA